MAKWLRDRGHDIVETRERGADPGDTTILEWAAAEARILVTIDTDFSDLVFRSGRAHCGIVRLPDLPAAPGIALLEEVLRHPLAFAR